jgi:hypothetical protein
MDDIDGSDLAELRDSKTPVTLGALAEMGEMFTNAIRRCAARVEALETRLAAAEQQRTMTFAGPHDPAQSYSPGAVVQRASAAWVCMAATSETPGASSHWRRLGGTQ